MNNDSQPSRAIEFEWPSRSHAPNFEVRSLFLSPRSASIEFHPIEIHPYEFHPSVTMRFAPKFNFIRFHSHSFIGELKGEGEGKVDANQANITNQASETNVTTQTKPTVQVPTSPGLGNALAEEELPGKPAIPLQGVEASAPSASPSSLLKPLSYQVQSSTLVVSGASTAKEPSQTGMVLSPNTESAKPSNGGMLSFAMGVGDHRTNTERFDSESSKASRSRSPQQSQILLKQVQKAQIDSIIDALAVNAKRLPVPKGMIELRDQAENSQRQSFVAKANANPFEILQLFIGTSNMVLSRSESHADTASPIDLGFDPQESSERATREDILVTLGIGAVLAIAIRKSRVRHQTEPFFATVRPAVTRAT